MSCKKIDEATEFDISYKTDQSLAASPVDTSGTVELISPEISTQTESKFASNGTAKDLVGSIKLSRFVLVNNSGSLDFLDGFTIHMQADGVPEVQVAIKNPVPKGVNRVEAEVTDNNIKDHLLKDKIRLRISLVANSLPDQEQHLIIEQTMRVSAKKLSKK